MPFDASTRHHKLQRRVRQRRTRAKRKSEGKIKGCVVGVSESRFAQGISRLHGRASDYTLSVQSFSHAQFRATSFASD